MKRRTAKAKDLTASDRMYRTAAAARVATMREELQFLCEHGERLCVALEQLERRIRMVELAITAEVAGTGAAPKRSHGKRTP